MTIAIAYPFRLDDSGKVITTEQYSKIYLDRVLTLLSTSVRQRPVLQLYGTEINKYLFETSSELENSLREVITSAIKIWLPDVSVQKITVGVPGEDGNSTVEVSVRLPNGNISSISLTTATFGYDGTITR